MEYLLASLFAVQRSQVYIFSIQQITASVPTLDVQIAIMGNNQMFLNTVAIMTKITEKQTAFTDIGEYVFH